MALKKKTNKSFEKEIRLKIFQKRMKKNNKEIKNLLK